MDHFELHSKYAPTGDQPQAIEALTAGLNAGMKHQVLPGVTGSDKTFTTANIIRNLNRPALVIAHSKTPSGEFVEFFPNNAVGYFVSSYRKIKDNTGSNNNKTKLMKGRNIR